MLRKVLPPDMTHQPRTAVLPLGVWAVLSTSNICGVWSAYMKEVKPRTVTVRVQTLMTERNFAVSASNSAIPMENIIAEAAANVMNADNAISAYLTEAMSLFSKSS